MKRSDGIYDVGPDGVARSLNAARDTVVDYVQLTERQVGEFFQSRGVDRRLAAGM